MPDTKVLLGALTILIGFISYSFYIKDVFRGRTKPEAFSWLIWGILAAITFFAQWAAGAAAGAWITAFTSVACFFISGLAFRRNASRVKAIDIISLSGAILGIVLWYFTNDALLAVILVIFVGALGFVPTFLKAYLKPEEETSATFALNASKFAISIFALGSFSLVTWLYPASLVLMNSSLALMLILRHKA